MIALPVIASARGGLQPRHQDTKKLFNFFLSAFVSLWQFSGFRISSKGTFAEHNLGQSAGPMGRKPGQDYLPEIRQP